MFYRYLTALLFLCTIYDGFSQTKDVHFRSKISENDTIIGINELIKLKFTADVDFEHIPIPFQDFEIISGPTPATYYDSETGKRVSNKSNKSFLKSYFYILKPTKLGELNIRSEKIEFERNIFKAPPLKVMVTDSVEVVNFVTRGMDTAKKEFQLVAKVLNPSTKDFSSIVYKLYFPNTLGIRGFSFLNIPDYKRFSAIDVPIKNYNPTEEIYKNKNCRSIILKKFDLSSKNTKDLKIEPLIIELFFEVATIELNDDGTRMFRPLYFHLKSLQE
jgi:hypothetical protein